jgi:hypothetical protein
MEQLMRRRFAGLAALAALTMAAGAARADEGGVGFWLPGQYASFAAAAPEPGFSVPTQSYVYSGDVDAAKALNRGRLLGLGLDADFYGQFIVPTFTPDATVLGARPSFSIAFYPGWSRASADVTVGPLTASRTDELGGFGDLYPTAQLYWSKGVHNWMAYVTGDVPIGAYSPDRLTNLGAGHGAIDVGGAYTYLNTDTGWEVSATAGLTHNFENDDTDYRNGVDSHLDVGVLRLVNERLFVGAAGFAYGQLSDDDGAPASAGGARSRTFGIGPQLVYNFDAGGVPIYANLRGYIEVDTQNRTKGGSLFLVVNIPISALAAAARK